MNREEKELIIGVIVEETMADFSQPILDKNDVKTDRLGMLHYLEKARDEYEKSDIDFEKEDLKKAILWLENEENEANYDEIVTDIFENYELKTF
ncbi:hypothetical protein [Fructobacillus fructosus]|uniref:Uncharacterized protein n=1 Tax=Fructobacillus fructosus TaxID=1631 RepID=A0ABN9Z114_9LACO|nr:unnamed protein product [Fructobacillus fructosus]CAK1229065.1 unnamed protein product [Fructobacillus fructosus]CAK1235674.1 unnamed protein product [Fructobacillus fructosus]CAK1245812.1 unnamed protein product [Fructobacillus fructosus]CAK1252091.1 unnamed protein product [Fructobacillus fructosus]